MMQRLWALVLALCWVFVRAAAKRQGADIGAIEVQPGSATTAARKYILSLRADYSSGDARRCANFWGDSAPRQRNPPAKAYRRAFRGVLEGIIADKGYSVTITKLSLTCAQPRARFNSNLKRITVVATFSPLTIAQMNVIFDEYNAAEGNCAITDGIKSNGGGAWPPSYFEYTVLVPGQTYTYGAVCIPESSAQDCWTRPWNPLKTAPWLGSGTYPINCKLP